jgi:putative membrane protein
MSSLVQAMLIAAIPGEGPIRSCFAPIDLLPGAVASAFFGFIGIILLLLGYWLFDLITPRIDVQKELTEKNMAVATVIAALLLGIAYVAAHVVQ